MAMSQKIDHKKQLFQYNHNQSTKSIMYSMP